MSPRPPKLWSPGDLRILENVSWPDNQVCRKEEALFLHLSRAPLFRSQRACSAIRRLACQIPGDGQDIHRQLQQGGWPTWALGGLHQAPGPGRQWAALGQAPDFACSGRIRIGKAGE